MNRSTVFLLIVVVAILISLKLYSDLRGENKPRPSDDFIAPSPAAAPAMPVLPVTPEEFAARSHMEAAIREFEWSLKQTTDPEELKKTSSLLQRLREVSVRLQSPDRDLAHELQEIREIRAALKEAAPRTAPVPAIPATPAAPAIPRQA
jgi:hypothetical protein